MVSETTGSIHPVPWKICAAFGITLAQFFSEDENTFALTPVQQHLIEASVSLTESQMAALIDFLNAS